MSLVYVPAEQAGKDADLSELSAVVDVLPESAVMYRVGGRSYPMRSSPKCITCQSPYRSRIETQILKGYSYAHITSNLPEDAGLSLDHIRSHVRNQHLPVEEEVKRRIIHDRADELGIDLEEDTGLSIDHIAGLKVIAQRGLEAMTDGSLHVSAGETIRALRYLGAFKALSGGDDEEVREDEHAAFQVMMEGFKLFSTPEQYQAFIEFVNQNSLLRRLRGMAPIDPDEMPVPAAVVGEPCPSCGRKVPRPRKPPAQPSEES